MRRGNSQGRILLYMAPTVPRKWWVFCVVSMPVTHLCSAEFYLLWWYRIFIYFNLSIPARMYMDCSWTRHSKYKYMSRYPREAVPWDMLKWLFISIRSKCGAAGHVAPLTSPILYPFASQRWQRSTLRRTHGPSQTCCAISTSIHFILHYIIYSSLIHAFSWSSQNLKMQGNRNIKR